MFPDSLLILYDPIADLVPDLKATPLHTLALLVRRWRLEHT